MHLFKTAEENEKNNVRQAPKTWKLEQHQNLSRWNDEELVVQHELKNLLPGETLATYIDNVKNGRPIYPAMLVWLRKAIPHYQTQLNALQDLALQA